MQPEQNYGKDGGRPPEKITELLNNNGGKVERCKFLSPLKPHLSRDFNRKSSK